MRTLAYLLLPCLAASLGAAAPPSADAAVLVRQLGADSFAERERADRLLLSRGKAAVPALREGAKGRDAEVRRRCVRLLGRIERVALEPRLAALLAGESKFTPPLPGWEKFRELAGADAAARSLYVELFQADRIVLEWVQGGNVGDSAGLRAEKLRTDMDAARAKKDAAPAAGRLAGVLLLATLSTGDDQLGDSAVNGVFYQRATAAHVGADPAVRRLAVQFFARQGVDPERLAQSAFLTGFLDMKDVRNDTLKPAALRALESALVPTPDLAKLSQAGTAIQVLGIQDEMPARTRKSLRKLAEGVAARPFKSEDTFAILSVLQCLRMGAMSKDVFEPQALALARRLSGEKFETSRLNEVHQFCQIIDSTEGVEAVERAACEMLAVLTSDWAAPETISEAIQLTQLIQLDEAREGLLVPALRKRLLVALEQPDDFKRLDRCVDLCFRAKWDEAEALVKMALRRRAEALAGDPTAFERFARLLRLARRIGADDVIKSHFEPALSKALRAAGTRELDLATELQALALARELSLKEGNPLALRIALESKDTLNIRYYALIHVAMLGTPAQVERLAPLLTDSALLARYERRGVTMEAQFRDVVLAAMVSASGQKMTDYGFPATATFSAKPGTDPTQFGFADDEAREKALAKWKKWAAEKKESIP